MHRKLWSWTSLLLFSVLSGGLPLAYPQSLDITGVSDRQTATDTVTLRVPSLPGYNYKVLLDGEPIPTDESIVVNRTDYHEVYISRTNMTTLASTNRLVRFIVRSSNRGSPETGLIEWTPFPTINSAAAEFAGAKLQIVAPADYPQDLAIPVIVWLEEDDGKIRRATGNITAEGFESLDLRLRRGHGSGYLPATQTAGPISFPAQIHSLQSNKTINIDASTAWTSVSGTMVGAVTWPENSRIFLTGDITVTSNLVIEAGTIIKLAPLADINIGAGARVVIKGTTDRPVVLTATGPVSPEVRTYAWGGFVIHDTGATLEATGAIMVGGGGGTSFSVPSGGGSHRSEQPVFAVHSGARAFLTNCYVLNTAGQIGNGYNSDVTFDNCLLQRAITAGEYVGGTIIVNKSALMEFPAENGVVNATIADADYDGIYFTTGTHLLLDSFFGYAKDDTIDSGSGGAGTVLVTNCWVESALHEALAWSGSGRTTWTYDTVLMNSGQGIECGWSSSSLSPNCFADRLLTMGNSVGARFGDNYDWDYFGRLRVTNSLILHNYRDIWGRNWDTTPSSEALKWGYGRDTSSGAWAMELHGNFVTSNNTNHPNNTLWNGEEEGWRLAHWMATPPEAPVGIALALWGSQFPSSAAFTGVPVRLSTFTTNTVSVNYTWSNNVGSVLGSGTLTFVPGETVKRILLPSLNEDVTPLIVTLHDPEGGELTGQATATYTGTFPAPQARLAPATNLLAGYRLVEGAFIRLGAPTTREVRVAYAFTTGSGQELETATNIFAAGQTMAQVLPRSFNPFVHTSLRLTLTGVEGGTLGTPVSVTYTNPVFSVGFPGGASQFQIATLSNGLTVSLTSPAPGPVSVDFGLSSATGVLTNGTISFSEGQSTRTIPLPTVDWTSQPMLRVVLSNAVGAQLGEPSTAHYFQMDPALPGTNATLVSRTASWRYRATASAAPADWNLLDFDDSTWPAGPAQLGFGESDQATPIPNNGQTTSYFRHRFVADPAVMATLDLWLLRDDGGVVYLNGAEVFRSPNMPAGAISYGTYTTAGQNGENTIDQASLNVSRLVAGTNIVAVEIHQADATSSDVSFALGLTGNTVPQSLPQNLRMGVFGNELTFGWADGAYLLQEADVITGPWTNVPGQSPISVPVRHDLPQKFYRLMKP